MPKTKKSAEEIVIDLVKDSSDLLDEALSRIDGLEEKVSQARKDSSAAQPLIEQIVDKLANLEIGGTTLISEGDKQIFAEDMQRKESLAMVFDQVIDKLSEQLERSGATKAASDLGQPSDVSLDSDGRPLTGFASLPSHRIQM